MTTFRQAIHHPPTVFAVFCNLVLGSIVYFVMSKILFKTCAPVSGTFDQNALSYINPTDSIKNGCWVKDPTTGKPVKNEFTSFNRPYFFATFNYLSYMFSIVVYAFMFKREKEKALSTGKDLPENCWTVKNVMKLAVPAVFDISSRLSMLFAATLIQPSIVTFAKGTRILWTAVFGVYIFKNKKLFMFHWFGVAMAVTGMLLVAMSLILPKLFDDEPDELGKATVGLCLAVGGELVRAVYLVVVEMFVKGSKPLDPFFTGGVLGLWGFVCTLPVLLIVGLGIKKNLDPDQPGVLRPSEDIGVSLYMISHSGQIIAIFGLFLGILFLFDAGCIMTSKYLSAVHNAIISVLRSVLIWIFEIFSFYVVAKKYGEGITWWSLLQLVGFVVLGVSTFVYNGDIKVKGFYYPPPKVEEAPATTRDEEVTLDEPARP